MLAFILAPENLPFSVALLVMLMIGLVEALGLGLSAVHLDLHFDAHADGPDLLAWLGIGRVPILMLLVVFLALFGMVGLAVQQGAAALAGQPLAPALASAVAVLGALPLTGIGARGLARIMPQDETTAVSLDSLVGKRGTVTIGTARRGSPAQVRVRDSFGQPHYVMVEPHDEAHPLAEGATVLLARREGHIFIGLGEADGITPHVHEQLGIG
jgi:membrane protein implicated in regulation of membrane protease activity